MHEDELARCLLVRACEESDPDGRLLEHGERAAASRVAHAAGQAAPEHVLLARAAPLADLIATRVPALHRLGRLVQRRLPAASVVGLGLAVGLAVDRLGATQRVNLLSFPLLGVLLWNLAVYAGLLLRPWRRLPRPGPLLAGLTWAVSPARWWARGGGGGPAELARLIAVASERFVGLWTRHAGALPLVRTRATLHAAAAAFALGTVTGLYVRGIAFEYRATWESTFLDAAAVHRVLQVVLGPAALLAETLAPETASTRLLDPAALGDLRAPADGDAAPWIHLWGLTMLLFVIGPRAGLALLTAWQARRLAVDLHLPLDDAYTLRLLARGRGSGLRIDVLPYSFHPSAQQTRVLSALLLDLFGARASVRIGTPRAYGDEVAWGSGSDVSGCLVPLFNLAQSPEHEVHGGFLEACKRHADTLLVVLDEESFQERFDDDTRRDERRRAWARVVRERGLDPVPLEADDDALDAARASLWRAPR